MCGPVAGPSQRCFHNGPQGRGYSGWDERWRVVSRLACHVAGANADRLRKGAWLPRSFTLSLSTRGLLSHFLKLLTDYRSVEAIDGDACHAVAPRLRDEGGPATPSVAAATEGG